MFVGITNTPRDYAWGSRTAIAEVLGREASGGPEAEQWLGAHPGWPSTVTDATPALAGQKLDAVLTEHPELLGGRPRLPFLMKVLAAESPLSLQVHPDPEQARAGFAREQEAGVPLDADERNYKDDSAKPELILALSPVFEALAGFQHVSLARMLFAELIVGASGEDRAVLSAFAEELTAGHPQETASLGSSADVTQEGMPVTGDTVPHHSGEGNALAAVVERLLRRGDDVDRLVAAVTRSAPNVGANSSFSREFETVAALAEAYPGDPGIVISLLMNRVSLRQGQALALTAGTLHAYLSGVGIEVMNASDNVLRGGLTPKHVDVDELLRVVRFEAEPTPLVLPETPVEGETLWRPQGDDFVLAQIGVGEAAAVHGYTLAGPETVTVPLTGPAIVLVLTGGVAVAGATDAVSLARGEAAYASPDEGTLTFSGSGIVYVSTTP